MTPPATLSAMREACAKAVEALLSRMDLFGLPEWQEIDFLKATLARAKETKP